MKRLVVNGCSYMVRYAEGIGHTALGEQLGITDSISIAVSGSCNTRILRTCLKDSYTTTVPTLYIVGLSFLGRSELPIRMTADPFEGKWINITNFPHPNEDYDQGWNPSLVQKVIDLRLKAQMNSIPDRLEELMYQILSTIDSLINRGHQILLFRQADDVYEYLLADPRFELLKKYVNIVDGLNWGANAWQFDHGVSWLPQEVIMLRNIRHPAAGEYQILNNFLVNYIQTNKLL